jgi:hypothetical protein
MIGVATVFAVLVGYEYLMKLAKKNHSEESEKHKKAINKEIDEYQKSTENFEKVKQKINNLN